MRITRLYLRNYRVYEQELNLEMPAGLVGIYGPNGSGKTTLLESILWTLYGKSRTAKDEIRTSGVNAECITEVEFEHEGHLYLVRRTISGMNTRSRPRPSPTTSRSRRASPTPRGTCTPSSAWTTPRSGRRCSPSRSNSLPSRARPPPSAGGWCCSCSASRRSMGPAIKRARMRKPRDDVERLRACSAPRRPAGQGRTGGSGGRRENRRPGQRAGCGGDRARCDGERAGRLRAARRSAPGVRKPRGRGQAGARRSRRRDNAPRGSHRGAQGARWCDLEVSHSPATRRRARRRRGRVGARAGSRPSRGQPRSPATSLGRRPTR